jgi:glycogen synthase
MSMMDIAMKMDFSWEISAQKYIDEYQHLME